MCSHPLQNRVAPDGTLHAVNERGTLMGNRGILHDPETKKLLGRNWQHKAWIACETCFRGRKRQVFGQGQYSELFFFDEVTALSAGHRPCYECRHADALRFAQCLSRALPEEKINAGFLNDMLHGERCLSRKEEAPVMTCHQAENLPDGVMFAQKQQYFVRRNGHWLKWSFSGYETGHEPDDTLPLEQVTPPLVVLALGSGYQPRWHVSV